MATLTASLEKWANKTAEQWNRLSPYDDQLRSALPRFLQMLDHQLKSLPLSTATRQIPKAQAQHAHSAVAIIRSLNAVV